MDLTAKFLKEDADSYLIGGYGIVWGGRDLANEWFEPGCDFWWDRLTEHPMVLYHHAQDQHVKSAVLGRVVSKHADDVGMWIEAQIDKAAEYAGAVRELVKRGVLGLSTGAVPHLVSVEASGKITSWPVAEISLTPTPCEVRTVGVKELEQLAEAEPALKAIATEALVKATLDAERLNRMQDSQFAYIDSDGGRHLPINDAAHCRAAMARFNQTQFESPDAKRAAARKILAAARRMGIEVADDSAVARAAKAWQKQLPEPPKAGDGGMPPEGSYEALACHLRAALTVKLAPMLGGMGMMPMPPCVCIVGTFADYCIATVMDGGDCDTYQVGYSLDADGMPMLGELRELDLVYAPAAPEPGEEAPLAMRAAWMTERYAALTADAKALRARRAKEGREFSAANRTAFGRSLEAMQAATEAMHAAMDEMRAVLARTEPQPAKAASVRDYARELALLHLSA